MLSTILHLMVLVAGANVFILALRFYLFFRATEHHLAKTLRFFLVEQLVTVLGLVFFSIRNVSGFLHHGQENEFLVLDVSTRLVILMMMIKSTHNLSSSIKKILE